MSIKNKKTPCTNLHRKSKRGDGGGVSAQQAKHLDKVKLSLALSEKVIILEMKSLYHPSFCPTHKIQFLQKKVKDIGINIKGVGFSVVGNENKRKALMNLPEMLIIIDLFRYSFFVPFN